MYQEADHSALQSAVSIKEQQQAGGKEDSLISGLQQSGDWFEIASGADSIQPTLSLTDSVTHTQQAGG